MNLGQTLKNLRKEHQFTQKEIADRLGYKTHSAVSKRMKIMNKDFKKFIGFEN